MGKIRLKNLIIIVICIIVSVITCIILYNYFHKDETINITKLDDSKDLYYFVEGNEYNLFKGESADTIETEFNGKFIEAASFSYPVININSIEIINIDNEIRGKIIREERNLSQNSEIGCIYVNKNNQYYRHESINIYSYQVVEYKNILSIVEKTILQTGCNGSTIKYQTYNVGKNGRIISNKELLNYYNFDEKTFLDSLNNYMNNGSSYNLDNLYFGLQEESIDIYLEDDNPIILNYDGNDFISKMLDGEVKMEE